MGWRARIEGQSEWSCVSRGCGVQMERQVGRYNSRLDCPSLGRQLNPVGFVFRGMERELRVLLESIWR